MSPRTAAAAGLHDSNAQSTRYDDAVGSLYKIESAAKINQTNIDIGVSKILAGEHVQNVFQAAPNSLAMQAAGQGEGKQIQDAANNILNSSLSSGNTTLDALNRWTNTTIVGNIFQNGGQLIAKWLSEFINGWIADTAQFLAKFLRIFILNPNTAIDNDDISKHVREGADIMYGIAVDLLLLMFILCIWKYWADASWMGAGNLMGPVGRLIFTAGLILAWPTLYAFEIQISNEMINAIYPNTPGQILMLENMLGQTVKAGVIAGGAAAGTVLAPVLASFIPAAGPLVGTLFYFASIVVFTILGSILVAELVYILVLKAIQTALLIAQYMFAPVFLVFFATPDTESYATGFVKAFVETSLWTFIWVGLLKILSIILYSDFNAWGKILISIGVLQLMIQVPTFLAKAQISPVSDFINSGMVFGGFSKALGSLQQMTTSLAAKTTDWFNGEGIGSQSAASAAQMGSINGTGADSGSSAKLKNPLNRYSTVSPAEAATTVPVSKAKKPSADPAGNSPIFEASRKKSPPLQVPDEINSEVLRSERGPERKTEPGKSTDTIPGTQPKNEQEPAEAVRGSSSRNESVVLPDVPVRKQIPPALKQDPPVTKQDPPVTKQDPPATKQDPSGLNQAPPVGSNKNVTGAPPTTITTLAIVEPEMDPLLDPTRRNSDPVQNPEPATAEMAHHIQEKHSTQNNKSFDSKQIQLPQPNDKQIELLKSIGVPPTADAIAAIQNDSIQSMHPARQKQAILAALAYTYHTAQFCSGNADAKSVEFQQIHGEQARVLPAAELNNVMEVYKLSPEDLSSPYAAKLISTAQEISSATQRDFSTTYQCVIAAAPYSAKRLGYLAAETKPGQIKSCSDFVSNIVPGAQQSQQAAIDHVLRDISSSFIALEKNRLSMTLVTNNDFAARVFTPLA